MNMDPLAFLDIFLGMTDAETILYHILTGLNVRQSELMPLGDLFQRGHSLAGHLKGLSLLDGTQCNCNIVILMDLYKVLHFSSPLSPPAKKPPLAFSCFWKIRNQCKCLQLFYKKLSRKSIKK